MQAAQSPDRATRINRIKSRGCPEIIQALQDRTLALKHWSASAGSHSSNSALSWSDWWKGGSVSKSAKRPGEPIRAAVKPCTRVRATPSPEHGACAESRGLPRQNSRKLMTKDVFRCVNMKSSANFRSAGKDRRLVLSETANGRKPKQQQLSEWR